MIILCIGMERCGTHSFANLMKNYGHSEHEPEPTLCAEAFAAFQGKNYEISHKIEKLKALKYSIVSESNHRFGFFAYQLWKELQPCKIVWLVRNPIDTITSRVATYAHWPHLLHQYPKFFQDSVKSVPENKKDFNTYRPYRQTWNTWRDRYLDEWMLTYSATREQFYKILPEDRIIFPIEQLSWNYQELLEKLQLPKKNLDNQVSIKTDSAYFREEDDVIRFARSQIEFYREDIWQKILGFLEPGNFLVDKIVASYYRNLI